jgi:5-(carboxyamino)imidazole ribonucleotide synthase
MTNLLGDIWEGGEPRWERAVAMPGVKLHLYGKAEPGREERWDTFTALAETAEAAVKLAIEARRCSPHSL